MPYRSKLATLEEVDEISHLWEKFTFHRAQINPSMKVKPNFDFRRYAQYQLNKSHRYCFILEHYLNENGEIKKIVGFIFTYIYDEAAPQNLPLDLLEEIEIQTPFLPRKVGSVLGLYVEQEHRGIGIKTLIESALKKAEELQITDLDLLISEDQKSLQDFLSKNKRYGFTRSAVQYIKHY